MLHLIPTEFKAKIPHTHSIPVGAELISRSLVNVPQFESLNLSFTGTWALKGKETELPVLEVTYRNTPESRYSAKETERLYGKRWEIKVFPVLRESKGTIKSLLIHGGLAKVAKWLVSHPLSAHHTGRISFTVGFDLKSETLRFSSLDELGRS